MILWSSVYIPQVKQKTLVEAYTAVHLAAGYQPYNPFPGGGGTPANTSELIRQFAAPHSQGWTRLIGVPQPDLLPALAKALAAPLLYSWVSPEDGGVDCIGGELALFQRAEPASPAPTTSAPASLLGELAQQYGVDPTQAEKMFNKSAQSVFGKLDADMQPAAMASLQGRFSWGLPGAQRLVASMGGLTVPDDWREPAFTDLAAAYQIACLLELDEDAPLLPGDEAILDRVEYPLDYLPLYFYR